jgi:hypothetical protein
MGNFNYYILLYFAYLFNGAFFNQFGGIAYNEVMINHAVSGILSKRLEKTLAGCTSESAEVGIRSDVSVDDGREAHHGRGTGLGI